MEELRFDGGSFDYLLRPSGSFSWVQIGSFGNPNRYTQMSDDRGPPMGYHWIEPEQYPGGESQLLRATTYDSMYKRSKHWEAFKPWTRKAKRNVPSKP